MGINPIEISDKKINQKKSMINNFPSLTVKNTNTESNLLTLGNININDSPSNKVKNMKILTLGQEYNFTNVNISDEENFDEEEKLFKGKKDKNFNLLIMNSLNNKNNTNNFTNEEKIFKKSKNLNKKINNESKSILTPTVNQVTYENNKLDSLDSGRDKIIELLSNMNLKSRGKFKFADFEGFVKRFL